MSEIIVRKIVKIDEELCDGCGECVPACAEGAIQVIDGKARLVDDVYCDGLGDCLGECPQGAITLEEREALPFDEEAVEECLREMAGKEQNQGQPHQAAGNAAGATPCTASRQIRESDDPEAAGGESDAQKGGATPRLQNWPIQMKLVSPEASFLQAEQLVIAADCVPFAYPDFHEHFLKGKALLIGCPKLDGPELYLQKLTEIFKRVNPREVTVAMMEVPCCRGMLTLVEKAREEAGAEFLIKKKVIKIDGSIQ